ncbi:MAG TPA: hypothetical protein VFK97_02385 [Candidatus Saccharimonadales bacterium]|nr:hypothetical protein [Candidatus Saccharimonadales bacterium]
MDGQVGRILRPVEWKQIDHKASQAVDDLRQSLVDAKKYSQGYELSEMRDEQIDNAKKARRYLNQARSAILKASEYNVFGPADVAQLTAKIDQAKADLK